ncbi:MAG: protein kinase domain-containing protein [Gemmatimonadaceae bacterium]
MNGSNEELTRALAGRYEIERELGRGGMAIVYLARDSRHPRHVAVKVLRPELASALGGERFVREIDVASRLTHPHILPLIDSGAAAGDLYYVMPFVSGETLRQRLERERQLPIDEALSIARQVASALDYAHSEGVIHRDIKPENILLVGGEVLVADFGLARALDSAASTPLTESGVAVGTPAYMSPEQATGERHVDHRSDVYSLACTLFEMIAGVPPFRGATAQALIAHHVSSPAPSLCRERSTCPELVDAAVQRGLAKAPADRFRTAGDLVRAAEDHSTTSGEALTVSRRQPRLRLDRRKWPHVLGGVGAAALAIAATTWAFKRASAGSENDLVAVLPFRVSANDPAVESLHLRVGMMDLLVDKFPRAVSVSLVMDAWQRAGGHDELDLSPDQNLSVARTLHAGKLVVGSVLRTPQGIKMTARLVDVANGAERAAASAEGPTTSYPALVDTVANVLLTQQAGEAQHLYLLQRLPTPAVSAYVSGKASFRAGKYDEAVAYFERALDSSRVANGESDFGLAALGLVASSNYQAIRTETGERGLRVAWASRDQFNEKDRVFLEAAAGPKYPLVSTRLSQIQAWDHALNVIPDEPQAYYQFGDQLLQFGEYVEWDDALGLARKSFEEALKRDSTFIPAVQRLAELSMMNGNVAVAEQLVRRLPPGDSASDRAGFLYWRLALAHNEARELADVRRRLPGFSSESAREIWFVSQLMGVAVNDAESALDLLRSRATRREDRATVAAGEYLLAMNEGRPQKALTELRRSIPEDEAYFTPLVQGQVIRDGLFGSGDGAAAVDAVNEITAAIRAAESNPSPTPIDMAAEYVQRCALEEWRLGHGNADSAAGTARRLRAILPVIQAQRFGGTNTPVVGAEPVCPAAIDAWAATIQKRPEARALVDRFDTTMAHLPLEADGTIGNVLAARLRLATGDTAAALRALRRRSYSLSSLFYLAVSLREEGRLAAATGDRKGAIRAYTHYLVLRVAPEPPLRHEADDVRAALGRLQVIAQAKKEESLAVCAAGLSSPSGNPRRQHGAAKATAHKEEERCWPRGYQNDVVHGSDALRH